MADLITTKIDSGQLETLAERLEQKSTNIKDLHEQVAQVVRADIKEQFDTEGRGAWAKLVKGTIATKQRLGVLGRGVLVRTGALRDSFTKEGAPGSINEVRDGELRLGSSLPYALKHQLGMGNNPLRPIIVETPQLVEKIVNAGEEYLSDL